MVIVNPRGAGGAGKTELVRRIMADYGRGRDGRAEPIRHARPERPVGYRFTHPHGGPPVVVLGHYESTSGGCDTIRLTDGGMDEVFRLADAWATAGYDVVLEGLLLSTEHTRSAALAELHELHVLRLTTPIERCVGNLITRRRARRDTWPLIARTAAVLDDEVNEACLRLRRSAASVEVCGFEQALRRARELLSFGIAAAARNGVRGC